MKPSPAVEIQLDARENRSEANPRLWEKVSSAFLEAWWLRSTSGRPNGSSVETAPVPWVEKPAEKARRARFSLSKLSPICNLQAAILVWADAWPLVSRERRSHRAEAGEYKQKIVNPQSEPWRKAVDARAKLKNIETHQKRTRKTSEAPESFCIHLTLAMCSDGSGPVDSGRVAGGEAAS